MSMCPDPNKALLNDLLGQFAPLDNALGDRDQTSGLAIENQAQGAFIAFRAGCKRPVEIVRHRARLHLNPFHS